jgi:hypothetical protein
VQAQATVGRSHKGKCGWKLAREQLEPRLGAADTGASDNLQRCGGSSSFQGQLCLLVVFFLLPKKQPVLT